MALIDNINAYWKLDDLNDSVASYHLTNNNSTPFNAAKIGNGADLGYPNSTKHLSTTSLLGMSTATTDRTYAYWLKAPTFSGGATYHLDFGHGYSAIKNEYIGQISWDGSVIKHQVGYSHTGGGGAYNSTLYTITAGTWYHFALVRSGTTMYSYINGVEQENNSAWNDNTGVTVIPDGFNIGNITRVVADFGVGVVDEFGVWSRALSASEISSLYNSGVGLQYPFSSFIPLIMMS